MNLKKKKSLFSHQKQKIKILLKNDLKSKNEKQKKRLLSILSSFALLL